MIEFTLQEEGHLITWYESEGTPACLKGVWCCTSALNNFSLILFQESQWGRAAPLARIWPEGRVSANWCHHPGSPETQRQGSNFLDWASGPAGAGEVTLDWTYWVVNGRPSQTHESKGIQTVTLYSSLQINILRTCERQRPGKIVLVTSREGINVLSVTISLSLSWCLVHHP